MPCGAMWALFVFTCRGRRPDGPNLGFTNFQAIRVGRDPCVPPHAAPPAGHTGPALQRFNFIRRAGCLHPAAGHAPYSRQGTRALLYRGLTLSAGRGAYTPPRGERIATNGLRTGLAMTKTFPRSYYENSTHLHRRA